MLQDLRNYIETETTTDVYPMHIPEDVSLPAIQLEQLHFSRHSDSNLNASNITERRIQLTIVSKTTKQTLDLMTELVDLLEGFSGVMGGTKVFMARVNNTVPLYNKQQQTYEYAVDIEFVILK